MRELAAEGLLQRVHGGALSPEAPAHALAALRKAGLVIFRSDGG